MSLEAGAGYCGSDLLWWLSSPPPLLDAPVACESNVQKGCSEGLPGGSAENDCKCAGDVLLPVCSSFWGLEYTNPCLQSGHDCAYSSAEWCSWGMTVWEG